MNPLVSFVVPAHNYGRYVCEAVDSLLSQTLDGVEVIVVDDASTDDTPEVLERYRGDERIRVERHAENRGNVRTYNDGLQLTRGRYVGLLSADDLALAPDAVARQVAVFEAHPGVGLVYSAYQLVGPDRGVIATERPASADYVLSGYDEFRRLLIGNHLPASGTLARRECHEQLGWYEPSLPHANDWDLWLRFATRYDVGYVAEPLYAYRVHHTNMSHGRGVDPVAAIDELRSTLRRNMALMPEDWRVPLGSACADALERALFTPVWSDLGNGRTRRAWRSLRAVVSTEPRAIRSRRFAATAARVALLTAVGPRAYHALGARGASSGTGPSRT